MSVTIHIVRHAQGPHNVLSHAIMMRDPFLTVEGLQQCVHVQQTFPFTIDAILSSPQNRAIETALMCFGQFVANGLRVDLHADLQETGNAPCNIGEDIPTLEGNFGSVINTDSLDDDWYRTGSALSSDPVQLRARAQRARRDIRAYALSMLQSVESQSSYEPDLHIAVVSHSVFIPFLTGDYSGGVRYFRNAEWRSYTFTNLRGTDDIAALVETDQSLQRRGATRPSPSQNVTGQTSIATHVLNRGKQAPKLPTNSPNST